MTAEEFNSLYDDLRHLPTDVEALGKNNKTSLSEKLSAALLALKCAEKTIFKQCDTISSISVELVKMSESLRMKYSDVSAPSIPVKNAQNIPVNVNQPPTIVLKPRSTVNTNEKPTIQAKFSEALKKVNVNNARVSENGYLIVNVQNEANHKKATDSLRQVFSEDFSFEEPKKLLPKVTITRVPKSLEDSTVITSLCEKDENLRKMISEGEVCELISSWNMKQHFAGMILYKNVAIKCSPRIRNYIMDVNEGYVYLDLVRCKTYDRFFITQCYHCCELNHIAKNCPNKNQLPNCAKCSNQHNTKECQSNAEKCVNCKKNYPSQKNDHSSFSHTCPLMIHEKK